MTAGPPTWSVTDFYPGLDSPTFLADFERLMSCGDSLAELFDHHDIRSIPSSASGDDTPSDIGGASVAANEVIAALNGANDLGRTLWAFVYAHIRSDSTDDVAQGFAARIGALIGRNRGLNARLAAWLAAVGVDRLATTSTAVAEHIGTLSRLAARAAHQMSEPEENLAAELSTTGSMAWTQLHAAVTSQLTVEVELPDGPRRMSIGEARSLATHAQPEVREAAFEAELRGWPQVAPVCAAALNGVKGEALILNRRRGWPSAVDVALFANVVDRGTYEAMTAAVVESLPHFQRFVLAKAARHGHPGGLPWWDLVAPPPTASAEWTWEQGLDLVRTAFADYGGDLGGIVDRAISERWIDALPRPGKATGASSMPFFADRSLVNLTFTGSLEQVIITAHELGHSYHNMRLAARTAMQRDVPMSLAETASIFCETLFVHVGLQHASGADRLAMLDADLCGATQTVVDIHTRVLFETAVFERRATRTLGVNELNELMLDAQRQAFGASVHEDTLHPYMWAVKQHYYTSNYYNWQYTFGLLFGLGLFAHYLKDPATFRSEYDEMLSRAGMDTADELAARFGIDLTDIAFWRSSIDVLHGRIDQYERLAVTSQ